MDEALVAVWNISKKEVEAASSRVNRLLSIKNHAELSKEEQQNIYQDWISIANRLRRGRDMINEMIVKAEPNSNLSENKRYQDLTNLYNFLFYLLGIYDTFFKTRFPRDIHQRLQRSILDVFED